MGASKRRKAGIQELKRMTRQRIEIAEMDRLYGSAVHEAAHVIFGLHFGIPLGEKGVSLNRHVFGHELGYELVEFYGFTDTRFSEWANVTRLADLNDYQRTIHAASYLIGPFAEYLWHKFVAERRQQQIQHERIEEIIRGGLNDFRGILGTEKGAERFGQLCFFLFLDPDTMPEGEGISKELIDSTRSWVNLSRVFLDIYFSDIVRFAGILCNASTFRLSKDQVRVWAERNLIRHELPESDDMIRTYTPELNAQRVTIAAGASM